jgi:glycosyltransferase involved in cell wall biosynthesis
MKIVVAQDSLHAAGGVDSYLRSVLPALQERGHQVRVLYQRRAGGGAAGLPDALGVEDIGVEAAMAALRSFCPDVCFSHNMGPLEIDRRLVGLWPVVKMMHGYFGTCISGLKSHAFPARCACDRPLGPTCLALYGPRRCGRLDPIQMVRDYRWARAQRSLFDDYAAIVVASRHMGEEYERNGVSIGRLEVLPLFSALRTDHTMRAAHELETVLFAGRMTSIKGGDVAIEAVARAAEFTSHPLRIVLAGDGPQRAGWQALASRLGVNAEFPGWLAADAMASAFRDASMIVVPSVWPEPFGLVGLEAGAFGVPAVAFDVGGVREWLDPDRSGMLVKPGEGAFGLAVAIASLVENPAVHERLGAGARAMAERLSLDSHVDRLEAVLQRAAGVS